MEIVERSEGRSTFLTEPESLREGSDDHIINGVALGHGDVTRSESGSKLYWSEDALRMAADTMVGRPLVVDHEDSSYAVVGEVTRAKFKENVGIVYEARLTDDTLAEKIQDDLLEVSVKVFRPEDEKLEERSEDVLEVDMAKIDNLSVVPVGEAPSNHVEYGKSDDFSKEVCVEGLEVEEELVLSEPRTPEYNGTETRSWGDIPADTLSHYAENLDLSADNWDDLTQEERNEVASHTLLGDPDADTASDGIFFPVVNASTSNLNRGALEAVRSGRGQSADIPQDTYEAAYRTAGRLLNEEFDADVELELEDTGGDEETSEEEQLEVNIRDAAEVVAEEWDVSVDEALEFIGSVDSEEIAETLSEEEEPEESADEERSLLDEVVLG